MSTTIRALRQNFAKRIPTVSSDDLKIVAGHLTDPGRRDYQETQRMRRHLQYVLNLTPSELDSLLLAFFVDEQISEIETVETQDYR